MPAAIPIIAGAAILGGLSGGERKKIQAGQQGAALSGLTFEQLQSFIDRLMPELQGLRSGGAQNLLANMNTTTNRAFTGAQTGFNDVLARSGLLGSGFNAGGNAALGLARGQDLNQNRTEATDFLLQRVMQALGLGISRGNSIMQGVTNNPITTSRKLGTLGGLQSGLNLAGQIGGGIV